MFVADMSRIGNGADHPGRQAPELNVIGRQGEPDANQRVQGAED